MGQLFHSSSCILHTVTFNSWLQLVLRQNDKRRTSDNGDTSRMTLRGTSNSLVARWGKKNVKKSSSTVGNVTTTALHLFSTSSLRKIAPFVDSCRAILLQAGAYEFFPMLRPLYPTSQRKFTRLRARKRKISL